MPVTAAEAVGGDGWQSKSRETFSVLRRIVRQMALTLPPLRRVVEQRDAAVREVLELLEREDERAEQQDAAARELRELRNRVNQQAEQQDAAVRELREIQDRVAQWRKALLPFPEYVSDQPEWFLPPAPHLATAPQRYTDNYRKYVELGGKMRPDDVVGFVQGNPLYVFDRARFYFFCLALDLIAADNLPGHLAELGVDKGSSASVLALGAERLGKKIYLLDTFEGFSEKDLIGNEARHRGHFTDTSLDLVEQNVNGAHVQFVKGYFPETAVQIPEDESFCLVHLDCDLYKPFASALDYFWPRLVPGGFLIMHDYTTLYWEGVEKAVNEFFANKAESIIPIPDMAGTVVVRKSK